MTPRQLGLIRDTFASIRPGAPRTARLFYERLFELDPSLRALFSSDLDVQSERLMRALSMVIDRLERIHELVPMLHELGRRHSAFGVRRRDYDTVGAALLCTLELELGVSFDAESRAAWADAYALLAATMQAGSEAQHAAA